MSQEDIIMRLQEPFTAKEIEWKIQNTTEDSAQGLAVAYVDSLAITKRLDETVGTFGWQNVYQPWQEKSQLCGISIYCKERKEWITKFGGAKNPDYEAIKGGLSEAFQMAASLWGIGRYLCEFDGVMVDIETCGKGFAIKQDQYGMLEDAYNKAIVKAFDTPVPLDDNKVVTYEPPVAPSTEEQAQASAQVSFVYKVQSAKPSGKTSTLLELVDNQGEILAAYVKNSDKDISVGACLRNAEIVQKDGSYGKYNLINSYEIAA